MWHAHDRARGCGSNLHAVQQCLRDLGAVVGSRNEQDLGEVKGNVEVAAHHSGNNQAY